MIDLHTHSTLSDGVLLPSELARRAEANGYKFLAITDHADIGTIPLILNHLIPACEEFNKYSQTLQVFPGVELTHIKPKGIADCVKKAKEYGAKIVVMHGETLVEPVEAGTNRAAILAGVNIIAHPGLISSDDVLLAKERDVFLEVTKRNGHCLTNGYVVGLAKETGAKLIIDSDAHTPSDLYTKALHKNVALGSGLTEAEYEKIMQNAYLFAKSLF